jgi:hypothetical protein
MSNPKLNFKEETSVKKTRSPPKKARIEQSTPKKKKLKLDADKAAEKAQHLRFGKAELTPDELSRLSKAQKREMYAANAARTAVHREIEQYEEDNVGVQALSEGEKAAGNVRDISKSRYARKLKKKAEVADLPILPQRWQYLVSASTKKQFGILKKLMHRADVESIICATDAG